MASNFEEDYDKSRFASPTEYCNATCLKKGELVLERTRHDPIPPSLLVSSDTIVVCDGIIYEKPIDRDDARRMLREISGKTIEVITAVCVYYLPPSHVATNQEYITVNYTDVTEMYMVDYGDDMIEAYLESGQADDHSGSLSYQGAAFLMVRGIKGCFYSLIGFPAARFHEEVAKLLAAHE